MGSYIYDTPHQHIANILIIDRQGYIMSERQSTNVDKQAKICKSILNISNSIRYVGAINKYGRTVTGFIRSGTQPMLGREQAKNEFFVLSTILNISRDSEDHIGRMEHMLVVHKKVKMVLIPSENIAYIVTISGKDDDYMNVIESVKKVITE